MKLSVSKCSPFSTGPCNLPCPVPPSGSPAVLRLTTLMGQQGNNGSTLPGAGSGGPSSYGLLRSISTYSLFSVSSEFASMLRCTFIFKARKTQLPTEGALGSQREVLLWRAGLSETV